MNSDECTLDEAAAALDVHRSTLVRWRREGVIPPESMWQPKPHSPWRVNVGLVRQALRGEGT